MPDRFIDSFDVVLLDMGLTFMFGADRFGEDEDFGGTYRLLGGTVLDDARVHGVIRATFKTMLIAARDPARYDDYLTVMECLRTLPEAGGLPEDELALLVDVFAAHEMGTIPETHAAALHRLHETHPLGLISNIWAPSEPFRNAFAEAGVHGLFDVLVFSSDHGHIKPSAYLFELALKAFDVAPARAVYVGDSHKRDVGGAKAAGMGAVWINDGTREREPGVPEPDLTIGDLRELL